MVKIKDRVNKKLNIVSPKEDISCVKFNSSTFDDLLIDKNITIYERSNFVQFTCVSEKGSLRFMAHKKDGYEVEVSFAFAKIFNFENDVTLSTAQIETLQTFTDSYLSKYEGSRKVNVTHASKDYKQTV